MYKEIKVAILCGVLFIYVGFPINYTIILIYMYFYLFIVIHTL